MSETAAPPPTATEAVSPPPSPTPAADAPTQGKTEGQSPATSTLTPPPNLMAEAKAEEAVPTEGEKPAEEAKPAEPVVVEYKDLKVPEGIAADDPTLAAFAAEAGKRGIPQETAEALLAEVAPKLAEQLAAPHKLWHDTQRKWQDEIKADPTIGGDNLQPTLRSIAKLLDNPEIVDPGFRDAMNFTGAGNNPAVVRTFARLAARLTESGNHVSGQPARQARSVAETFYPSMQGAQSGA